MKKIIVLMLLLLTTTLISCEETNTNNNEQDPSLEGVDLSKYEMPQTDFMNDGHELSNFEKIAKHVILNGTFVFEPILDGIGYEIILEGNKESNYSLIFFCVNYLKIARIDNETLSANGRKTNYKRLTYVKLYNDNNEELNLCYKLLNTMGEAVSIILSTDRATFNSSTNTGEFLLFRNNTRYYIEEDVVTQKSVSLIDSLLNKYNEIIGSPKNLPLSTINFLNY